MPADMLQATKMLLSYVRDRKTPGANPLPRAMVPWEQDLRGQEQGGSANHGWLAWILEYLRGDRVARGYLVRRLRWELRHGLMAQEQMSPTYGGLHLGCVALLWYVSWHRGDEELSRLAGAWLERVLLLECLTGRREGDRCRSLSPGMRADHRSVTEGRQTEGAIVGRLLGIPQSHRLDHSTFWGPLWDAVLGCEGIRVASMRVRGVCETLLSNKEIRTSDLHRARLMVPMRFYAWPNTDWFAWIPRSTHGQDPPCMGNGWIDGEHLFLWPFEDHDPPETGWRGEAEQVALEVYARWYRRGRLLHRDSVILGDHREPEIIGGPDGPDPLDDLPPMPKEHPWGQGEGRGPRPEPDPGPPEAKPVDVPWEMGVLRKDLAKIRDKDRARWKRLTAHRALATLDRLGAWEGLEEEERVGE